MPRINVEEAIWGDERYKCLAAKVGPDLAIGLIVNAWRIAQQFWIQRKLVPVEIWNMSQKRKLLIEFGLAEISENIRTFGGLDYEGGVYVRGSEEQFAWLVQKIEAGRKGGLAKAANAVKIENYSKSTISRKNEQLDLAAPLRDSSGSYPLTPTLTLTLNTKDKEGDLARENPRALLPVLADIWNQYRGGLPEVKRCAGPRTKKASSRWKENPNPTFWEEVVTRMAKSSFCNGSNDRKWIADFDFLLQPDTASKVIEGKYDDRGRTPPGSGPKKNRLEEIMTTPYSSFGEEA